MIEDALQSYYEETPFIKKEDYDMGQARRGKMIEHGSHATLLCVRNVV